MFVQVATVVAIMALLFGVVSHAQNPKNVRVTSWAGSNRCIGASKSKTISINNQCQRFNARSYKVNSDDDDCVTTVFSDDNCENRIARREFNREFDDDGDNSDCERMPRRGKSFKVRCLRDDDRFDD